MSKIFILFCDNIFFLSHLKTKAPIKTGKEQFMRVVYFIGRKCVIPACIGVLRKQKSQACVSERAHCCQSDESRTKREEEEFKRDLWVQVGGVRSFTRRRESLLTDRRGGFGVWSGADGSVCGEAEENFQRGAVISFFSLKKKEHLFFFPRRIIIEL